MLPLGVPFAFPGPKGVPPIDIVTLLGLAVGLAMDAFAVSIGAGITLSTVNAGHTFRLAFNFGFFQFLMPVVGYLAGKSVGAWICGYDHWIALALLAFVGGKMIVDGIAKDDGDKAAANDPTRGMTLLILSIATSIDALAVGLTLGVLNSYPGCTTGFVDGIVWPGIVIGVVAAAFTAAGLHIGRRVGEAFGKRMEVAGGLVLVGIGVKIAVEHFLKA